MSNRKDIAALDAEVVKEFGWTSASTLEELYAQIVRSYINMILDDDGFWGYADPFSRDEMRREYHNAIAHAWNIPRKLVSIALESVVGEDGHQRTDCFNLHVKTKDMNLVIKRFLDRLAEIRHEFYIEKKHWELVDRVGNTWVEKGESKMDLDSEIDLDGLPDMRG
jgi:hypothetical protein